MASRTQALSDDAVLAGAAALVDTLLPGDEAFPAASATGAHRLLMSRWGQRCGAASLPALLSEIGIAAKAGENERISALAGFAAADPDRFALLRRMVYLAYYETPAVVAAIAALGHDYRAAPQPDGYALRPFDAAIDAPKHGRGAYMATDAVRRVDMTGLAHLEPRP